MSGFIMPPIQPQHVPEVADSLLVLAEAEPDAAPDNVETSRVRRNAPQLKKRQPDAAIGENTWRRHSGPVNTVVPHRFSPWASSTRPETQSAPFRLSISATGLPLRKSEKRTAYRNYAANLGHGGAERQARGKGAWVVEKPSPYVRSAPVFTKPNTGDDQLLPRDRHIVAPQHPPGCC